MIIYQREFLLCITAFVLAGCAPEIPAPKKPVETKKLAVTSAAPQDQILDLEKFPLLPTAKKTYERSTVVQKYSAAGAVEECYEHLKTLFYAEGWREVTGDETAVREPEEISVVYEKNGEFLDLWIVRNPMHELNAVVLMHCGNMDLRRFPLPPAVEVLYQTPTRVGYATLNSETDAASAIKQQLTADGWQGFGSSDDSLLY